MKSYLLLAVCLVFAAEVYGACNRYWLFEPNTQCEIGTDWEEKEECLKCYCTNKGWVKECCDISPYPVIKDTERCELVREDCVYRIVPKSPRWARKCKNEGRTLLG